MNHLATTAAIAAGVYLLGALSGCGNSRACVLDEECFAGEYCGDGECQPGPKPVVIGDADGGTDASAADVNGAQDMGSNNRTDTGAETCQVDLFGNSCNDDEFEENDLYTQTLPLPLAQDSWCDAGTLVTASQSFSGTLCPGDQADLFRFLIDNRSPNACLAQTYTMRITVELDVPCDSTDLVRIFPYLGFENPISNSPCGQDEDLRCTVSADQKTYTFERIWQAEQLPDQRLNIEPRQDDVQVNYMVTVEVIQ